MNEFEIIVLSESDWREYKSIRLDSLRDSPDSFGSTYEWEISFEPEQWKSRLRISSKIHDVLVVAAVVEKNLVGLLSCMILESGANSAHLYQMWVSPENRNRGIGSALIRFVKIWAIEKGIEKLVLSVTTTNYEAISLYKSIGFNPVGSPEPLRDGSVLQSQIMELEIKASNA